MKLILIPGTMEPPGIPKANMGRAGLPRLAPVGQSGLAIATPPIWPGSSEATPPGRISNY